MGESLNRKRILKDLKAARVRVEMNTGTRRHKPTKGKGSYSRKQKHRSPDQ